MKTRKQIETAINSYTQIAHDAAPLSYGALNNILSNAARGMGFSHLFDSRGFYLHLAKQPYAGKCLVSIPMSFLTIEVRA